MAKLEPTELKEDAKVVEESQQIDTNSEENKTIIESMLRDVEKAKEPGGISRGSILNIGSDDMPSPMIVSELTSAGHSIIYDTKTGVSSKTNNNMLRTQLNKKREDGSYVYSTRRPDVELKIGKYACMLHISDKNRRHYDEIGLAVCPKSNLNSPYQVRRHMEKRHPMEWQAIEQERKDSERIEDRKMQDAMIKGIQLAAQRK